MISEKLLILCFIFDPRIQKALIRFPQLEKLPIINLVDYDILRLCDIFLEGTVIDKAEIVSHGFIKSIKFSDLVIKYWADSSRNQVGV